MGDACVTLADDEYSLWYNPALLGRNQGVQITPLNPDFAISYLIDDSEKFDKLSDTAEGIANTVMGIPLHFHLGYTPGIKIGSFGFSFLANAKTNAILLNTVHPLLDVDYRYDRGFAVGYAYTFGRRPKVKKKGRREVKTAGVYHSLGVSAKFIHRDALVKRYDLFGTELMNRINSGSSDYRAFRRDLGYTSGSGWGFDVGWDTVVSTDTTRLSYGISLQDVGDTNFNSEEGTGFIPRETMKLSMGVSFTFDVGLFYLKTAVDVSPINQELESVRMLKAGAEIGLPIISGLVGFNGGYMSLGVTVDLWLMEIHAGFYGIEVGEGYRQLEGKRGVIYLNFLDINWNDIEDLWTN